MAERVPRVLRQAGQVQSLHRLRVAPGARQVPTVAVERVRADRVGRQGVQEGNDGR